MSVGAGFAAIVCGMSSGAREEAWKESGCRLGFGNVQICVHLLKGALGLGEEVVYYALAEIPLVVVVHLEDLLERRGIDLVLCAGNRHDVSVFDLALRQGMRVRSSNLGN